MKQVTGNTGHGTEKKPRSMSAAREYCLKLEKDREYCWRHTKQGKFESSFASLDALKEKFDDPSKIAVFSDGGAGANRIRAFNLSKEDQQMVKKALSRLSKSDRKFAQAVLAHKTRQEMGIGKRGFNKRLASISKRLQYYTK